MIKVFNTTKVLIIDDSAFMRKIIGDLIQKDPRCKVIGTARNGKEGLEKIITLQPDVVLLDIEMPIMNGLELLEIVMKTNPVPIIIISTLAIDGAKTTIQALELGAIDFITKPSNIFHMDQTMVKEKIIQKILMASSVKTTCLKSKNNVKKPKENTNQQSLSFSANKMVEQIVAIGVSTGGPRALQRVIPLVPKNIKASILIVQHMPPGFTKSFAERLNQLSKIIVKEAEDGDVLQPGVAYIAPGDYHMIVKEQKQMNQYFIQISKDAPVRGHRPSVDIMMNSLVHIDIKKVIGVIMTGMGSDGTQGMTLLKQKKDTYTIAQDEASCVVYGMPKAAVEAGIIDEIVPLDRITNKILQQLGA